jgi:hypothetical protein
MSEGITSGEAFNAAWRLRLANVYALIVVITLVVSVGVWKVFRIL